jgi:threonine dehydrogenase-like Zn-dependent dehydrogenase
MGARVIALDVSPERLALAKSFGAEKTLDSRSGNPSAALKELTHGEGVDLALDCSANSDARLAAVQSTRTWGTVCFVGEGGSVTLDVSKDLLRRQITLIGSWTFSVNGQDECARFIAERGIALSKLITQRYAIDEAAEAYRLFDTQTTGKGVFVF